MESHGLCAALLLPLALAPAFADGDAQLSRAAGAPAARFSRVAQGGCSGLSPDSLDRAICEEKDGAVRLVLNDFLAVSRYFRKSGGEKTVREALVLLAQSKGLDHEVDASGNLVIRVPGVGSAASQPPIALQTHMDMVVDVDAAVLDRLSSPTHKVTVDEFMQTTGVQPVVDRGWVHARDYQSTLGADDGLGMAMSLRYAEDRAIPHPPLELIFTRNEETGDAGGAEALGQTLLTARRLVNIDGDDIHKLFIGCLGAGVISVKYGQIEPQAVSPGYQALEVRLLGLPGGHSGLEIYRGRANAVKLMAALLGELKRGVPEIVLLQASAGNGKPNQIANKFDLTVAVPAQKAAAAAVVAEAFWQATKQGLKDEEEVKALAQGTAAFSVSHAGAPPTDGLPDAAYDKLVEVIGGIDDGVVEKALPQDGLPHPIWLSSNLGYLDLAKSSGRYEIKFSVMPRSFVNDRIERFSKKIVATVSDVPFHKDVHVDFASAWTPNQESPLLRGFSRRARQEGLDVEAVSAEGGAEPALFMLKFPGLDAISIGANIKDEHSVHERFEISSVGPEIRLLDAVLAGAP